MVRPGRVRVPLCRGVPVTLDVSSASERHEQEPIAAELRVHPLGGPQLTIPISGSGPSPVGPLPPGPAKLLVSAPGHATEVVDLIIPERGGDLGEVRLRPGGSRLRGRLGDLLRERATEVYFRFAGAGIRASLEGDGRFELRGVPPTRGSLIVRRHGRELLSRPVSIDGPLVDLGLVGG
jgi:hypothetical protein